MRRLRDTALAMVRVAQIAFLYFLRISFLFTVWARAATGQHWNLPSIDQGGKRRHANAAFTIKFHMKRSTLIGLHPKTIPNQSLPSLPIFG